MTRFSLSVLLGLTLAGCPGSSDPFVADAVLPLEDAVVAVDQSRAEARVVQLDGSGAVASRADVTFEEDVESGFLLARPDGRGQALFFHPGFIGTSEEEPIDAELRLLGATGELASWTLDGSYASFAPDPGGRYVLVSEPTGRITAENRVEVIDLDAPGLRVPLNLRSLGGEVPDAAAFSPPLPVEGSDPLRVVALFAAGQLSLFDLDAPETPPATIPTTVTGTGRGPTPVEARFVGREVVVRTQGQAQLLVLTLNDFVGEGGLRFDPSIRTLATAGPVRQLEVDTRSDPPRLLALAGSRLHVFDLATGAEAQVAVPPTHANLTLFEGPAPGDPTVRPRLVTYGASSVLTFVDLGERPAEVLGASDLTLQGIPAGFDVDADAGRLVLYGGSASPNANRAPLAILDLFDRSATPLGVMGLDRAVLAPAGRSLWLAGTGDGYVGRLDIDTGALEERFLAETDDITTLLPLGGTAERALVFVNEGRGTFDAFRALTPGMLEDETEPPLEAF